MCFGGAIFQSVICIFHCSGWEIEELLSPPSRPYPVDSYILVAYSLKVLLSDCYVQIQNLEDLKVSGGDPVVPSPLRNWPRLTCLHERYQTMSTAKSQVLPNQECYQTKPKSATKPPVTTKTRVLPGQDGCKVAIQVTLFLGWNLKKRNLGRVKHLTNSTSWH